VTRDVPVDDNECNRGDPAPATRTPGTVPRLTVLAAASYKYEPEMDERDDCFISELEGCPYHMCRAEEVCYFPCRQFKHLFSGHTYPLAVMVGRG
jgi:hypothetical protein